jgi:catechol 2,3-dioxygenase-like lactoylglutathione lyase family enzyme
MQQRVSVVTLGVTDLARSRAFYQALGWSTTAAPSADVVFFEAGRMILALWGRDQLAEDSCVTDGGGWGGVTLAHNVGASSEVDAVMALTDRCTSHHRPTLADSPTLSASAGQPEMLEHVGDPRLVRAGAGGVGCGENLGARAAYHHAVERAGEHLAVVGGVADRHRVTQ